MGKSLTVFLAVWTAAAACGNPLAQPALNPVTALPPPTHPPVALVEGGVPRIVLVWDSAVAQERDPPGRDRRTVREAVRTLRREIGFCTGAEIEVVDAASATVPDDRTVILVGCSTRTDALGIGPTGLPPEGFIVTTFSNGVAIVGNDCGRAGARPSRATLWGAYDFLERFFGCRYYYPGPDGSVRPACTNLVLAPCAYTDAPRFRNRGVGFRPDVETVARTIGTPLVLIQQPQTQRLWREMKLWKGASANLVKPVKILDIPQKQQFFFELLEENQEKPDI